MHLARGITAPLDSICNSRDLITGDFDCRKEGRASYSSTVRKLLVLPNVDNVCYNSLYPAVKTVDKYAICKLIFSFLVFCENRIYPVCVDK